MSVAIQRRDRDPLVTADRSPQYRRISSLFKQLLSKAIFYSKFSLKLCQNEVRYSLHIRETIDLERLV